MNERTRILRLVEEGKITPDEAAMLLEALAEVEAPRFTPAVPPLPPVPPEPLGDWGRGKLERLTEAVTVSYPSHLRWLKVRWMRGDLEVRLDPVLAAPKAKGMVELVESAEGLEARPLRAGRRKAKGDSYHDLELQLPQGWGLLCEVMSGDLTVEGLPYVRGRVMSGDVTLEGVQGVDLRVASGDLEARLHLTEGGHYLEVQSGDASIALMDSSVRLEGQVRHGDLEATRRFVEQGGRVTGVVGEGQAHLRVEVLHGDLMLEDRTRQQEEV